MLSSLNFIFEMLKKKSSVCLISGIFFQFFKISQALLSAVFNSVFSNEPCRSDARLVY